MNKFYFQVWLFWALRVSLSSVGFGVFLSLLITSFVYVKQGMVTLEPKSIEALFDIFVFWFAFTWNFTLLLALFRSIKGVFNSCHNGYVFRLLGCSKDSKNEILTEIGYGDILRVWRKWFMLLIWLVGSEMVLALTFTLLFTSYNTLFEWFNIYVLFTFVLLGGYLSFVILGSRCKQIRIEKC